MMAPNKWKWRSVTDAIATPTETTTNVKPCIPQQNNISMRLQRHIRPLIGKIEKFPAKQVLWEISGKPIYKHLQSAFLSYFWKQQADSAKQQCANEYLHWWALLMQAYLHWQWPLCNKKGLKLNTLLNETPRSSTRNSASTMVGVTAIFAIW
jgi:hypothetical protein